MGSLFDWNVSSYMKPPGSFMLKVEADCCKNAAELLEELLPLLGRSGWEKMGDGEELEAIWVAKEGEAPPISKDVTWAHVQTIPASALPISRRTRLN